MASTGYTRAFAFILIAAFSASARDNGKCATTETNWDEAMSESSLRTRWDNVPENRKLSHLYDWCENLTTSLEEARRAISSLHDRLSVIEAANEKRADNS
jgi:hypothetical protein